MRARASKRVVAVLATLLVGVLGALVGTDSALAAAPSRRIVHGSRAPHVNLTHRGATQAVGCGGALIAKPGGGYWQCSFDDEFNGTSLDRSQWTPQQTSSSNYVTGPAADVACYEDSPNNVAVSGGMLQLTVRAESAPFTCHGIGTQYQTSYTAGMVSTISGFHQAYGRYEVRAKLPTTTAKGLQETFWLYPTAYKYGAWPASGEIDFAEFYSEYASLDVPYLHYNYDASTVNSLLHLNTVTAYDCSINYGAFNTYDVQWAPGTMTILLNGRTCLVDNYSALGLLSGAPFDQPFFLILTQALGIGDNAFDPATTPLPATTQIDYVRVWK